MNNWLFILLQRLHQFTSYCPLFLCLSVVRMVPLAALNVLNYWLTTWGCILFFLVWFSVLLNISTSNWRELIATCNSFSLFWLFCIYLVSFCFLKRDIRIKPEWWAGKGLSVWNISFGQSPLWWRIGAKVSFSQIWHSGSP